MLSVVVTDAAGVVSVSNVDDTTSTELDIAIVSGCSSSSGAKMDTKG